MGTPALSKPSIRSPQGGPPTPSMTGQEPAAVMRLPPPDESREPSLPMTQASLPADDFARHLCASMKVPEGCECTLRVPCFSFESRKSTEEFSIDDPEGSTVMRVSFSMDHGSGPHSLPLTSGAWRLNLYGAGQEPMGFCQEEQADSPEQRSRTVHEASSGRLFALLRSSTQIAHGYE